MSPADGPASPSCTRAMPQAAAVAYTASTLGAAARCSKSTSFLPLMPLSRLAARHSRMLSRSYGGRVCGAVACVWPVLNRLLSVPCLGHKNRTRGAAQGPSKPRNRQMSQPGSPRAGPSLPPQPTRSQSSGLWVRFLAPRPWAGGCAADDCTVHGLQDQVWQVAPTSHPHPVKSAGCRAAEKRDRGKSLDLEAPRMAPPWPWRGPAQFYPSPSRRGVRFLYGHVSRLSADRSELSTL